MRLMEGRKRGFTLYMPEPRLLNAFACFFLEAKLIGCQLCPQFGSFPIEFFYQNAYNCMLFKVFENSFEKKNERINFIVII